MQAPMTTKGALRLRAELEDLKSNKRPEVISAIAEARAHGDLKENAEYHAAREQQGFIEGRPHIVDLIKNGEIAYIVNTTEGRQAIADSFSIRREALQARVTYSTTVSGARALLHSLDFRDSGPVWSLQELHAQVGG